MTNADTAHAQSEKDVARRSVAKGAAWTLPAVLVAAGAPSLAASPTDCQWVINLTHQGSRQPVNNRTDQLSFQIQIAPNNQQPHASTTTIPIRVT